MQVDIPRDLEPDARAELLAREKAYSQGLQRDGRWRHIWRIAGQHANISIFDVDGNDALHQILWELPLFPYMAVSITPLAHHPSDIISPNDVPLDGRG